MFVALLVSVCTSVTPLAVVNGYSLPLIKAQNLVWIIGNTAGVMVLDRNQKPLIELATRGSGSTGQSGQLCLYHNHPHTNKYTQRSFATGWQVPNHPGF